MDFQLFDLVYRVICKQVIVLIHVYNFFFRDHFFDSNERARLTKEEECLYHPQPLNKPARGEQPIRIQYGYRINEAKLLPSQRMGLYLPNDV